jgi:hypothetical protein
MRRHSLLPLASLGLLLFTQSTLADGPPVAVTETVAPAETAVRVYRDVLDIQLDFAHILSLDAAASTVAVGNTGIVQASLSDDQTIVLTGQAPGTTNLIILNAAGDEIYNALVRVVASGAYLVTVYRGGVRETYSCGARCTPTASIGDDGEFFSNAVTQIQTRQGIAGTAE